MKQPLHVLHIEDSKEDSELVRELLLKNGLECRVTRVEARDKLFDALQSDSFDLILADCKLPGFSGLQALEIAHALKPEVPFVFVSGTIGEETAIESLRNGATDYVLKNRLIRLVPAVRRALAETEERMLCREMQHRLREMARLEAISTLSNGIAHDFNNILTIILGHASLLTLEYNRPERVLEITDTITHAAQRATEVVQQLMAFACKSNSHLAPTDLNRYIQDNLHLLRGKLPPRIEMTFEPTPDMPNVLADTGLVDRVLANLIANSVDSMPEEGRITLSTRLAHDTELPGMLPEMAASDYVCLKMTDTGRGMDPMTREHVFEPFYTTKERGRGTGLGLPVVYGLMRAQNGHINLESEPDKGTSISLFFPTSRPTPAKTPPVSRGADPSLCGSETILVVEDEADVCFFLETILQSHGYQVLTAHDHDEALKLFQERGDQIQLVFSDIGLPKVDGIMLCSKLKRLKPTLLVVLASGYSLQEYKPQMDELRPEASLSKPYNTHDILKCVRMVLSGSRATALA